MNQRFLDRMFIPQPLSGVPGINKIDCRQPVLFDNAYKLKNHKYIVYLTIKCGIICVVWEILLDSCSRRLSICFYNDYVMIKYKTLIVFDSIARNDRDCSISGSINKYDTLIENLLRKAKIKYYVDDKDLNSFKAFYQSIFDEFNKKNAVIYGGL